MTYQTTIKRKVSCSGIGLHSGELIQMTLCPNYHNSGILFKRLDVDSDNNLIPARYDLVSDTKLGTTIKNSWGISVSTIEHLMAAFYGAGIDNCIVEISGPEIPIMDGSSKVFLELIEYSGIRQLMMVKKEIQIMETIEVFHEDSYAIVRPSYENTLKLEIDFRDTIIGKQTIECDLDTVPFQYFSDARTFGFINEIEKLRTMGLAKGASYENAIAIGNNGVLNKDGLRFENEFVRHKALDCLGDLYLSGCKINGSFEFYKPGHTINNLLLHRIFSNKQNYLCCDQQLIAAVL